MWSLKFPFYGEQPDIDLSTWEGRMAEKARLRADLRLHDAIAAEDRRHEEEYARRKENDYWVRYEGTCDVCGQVMGYTHYYSDGLIDIGIDVDTNKSYTWIRHVEGWRETGNKDCNIYSSVLHEVDRSDLKP